MKIIIPIILATYTFMGAFLWHYYKLYKEKREKQWDEISNNASLQKDLDELRGAYHILNKKFDCLNEAYIMSCVHNGEITKERDAAQDKLASIICQHESHVWIKQNGDMRCKKCGKRKVVDEE